MQYVAPILMTFSPQALRAHYLRAASDTAQRGGVHYVDVNGYVCVYFKTRRAYLLSGNKFQFLEKCNFGVVVYHHTENHSPNQFNDVRQV